MSPQSPAGRVLVALDPATLRELATIIEHRSTPARTLADPGAAAAELATLLERGGTHFRCTLSIKSSVRRAEGQPWSPHPWWFEDDGKEPEE